MQLAEKEKEDGQEKGLRAAGALRLQAAQSVSSSRQRTVTNDYRNPLAARARAREKETGGEWEREAGGGGWMVEKERERAREKKICRGRAGARAQEG